VTCDKREVRDAARAARAGVDAGVRDERALAVAALALRLPPVADARAVLAYAATAEELDPAPLVARLRARGARIAYPRACADGVLALHWLDEDAELVPGYCGIREPDAGSPEADVDELDLVLVPGVAFDEACARLGMGGGFYDRLLPRLAPAAAAIGLAFDEQVVACVPTEAHDVRLAAVVTPTRVLRPAGI
jgi:5-formyltetrahydrofolate cyclo-ligase